MFYNLSIKLTIIYNLQSRNPQIKTNLKALSRGVKIVFVVAPPPELLESVYLTYGERNWFGG